MTGSETAFYCCLVSLLWGTTNPLIKKSTKDITKVKANNSVQRFIYEVKYLSANWMYIFLFILNQLGSVLYFVLLQSLDLSLIVPLVNTLTFIITGFVGSLIGENTCSFRTYFGIVVILIGITFCMLDKIQGPVTLGI